MQGTITISTPDGDTPFAADSEQLANIIKRLTDSNCLISKISLNDLDLLALDVSPLFSALKANKSVVDLQIINCKYDAVALREKIDNIIGFSTATLNQLMNTSENQDATLPTYNNQLPDPSPIIKVFTSARNYTLRNIILNSSPISSLWLELNSTLASWNSKNFNLKDIYKIVSGYYLILAIHCAEQNQDDLAMKYANLGYKYFSQSPVILRNNIDQSIAIRYNILFGNLHLCKEEWELAISMLNKADNLEQILPENKRTDDHWRDILNIKTSLAYANTRHQGRVTANDFYQVIMALQAFCNIDFKIKSDVIFAEKASALIANLGSTVTNFIYEAIFNSQGSTFKIHEKAIEAYTELMESNSTPLKDLFISLLIFVLNEHNTQLVTNNAMKTYLQNDTNLRSLQKILIDLTTANEKSNDKLKISLPEAGSKPAKTSSKYFSIFTTPVPATEKSGMELIAQPGNHV